MLAIKIRATNDRNGNPRRGWLVYTNRGDFRGFVDEGYSGEGALRLAHPGRTFLVLASVKFYNETAQE